RSPRTEPCVEVPSGDTEQGGLTTNRLHTHSRAVIRCAVEVVTHAQIEGEIGRYLPGVLKETGVVVLMVYPGLHNAAVLESNEVLLVRREQEEVLSKRINRAGKVGQQLLRGVISFEFSPRKLVVVIPEMATVPMPKFSWGRLLMASSCPLLEYVASKPPWNEWLP